MNDPMPAIRSILGMAETEVEVVPIDHMAEARNHIEWAHEQQAKDGEYDHSVLDNATIAVAEATLALAEQQRIANKLAYVALFPDNALAHQYREEVEVGL